MLDITATKQGLDQALHSPHSHSTCGQSRGGGLVTSNRTRRSRCLGRVAVAYVQSSLKGGGALCVRRVTNTRLCPVPLSNREALMRQKRTISTFLFVAAALAMAPTRAQASSVDSEFCNNRNVTQLAAKLTRDWGERFEQKPVELVASAAWIATGEVVEADASGVTCRITFSNITTSTYPVQRLALKDVDFRYSELNGQPQIAPVTLPLSGMDGKSAILAIWERLFINDKSYRTLIEEKAEEDPKIAAALGELLGRPKGDENKTWDPAPFCQNVNASTAAAAIIRWAETTNQVRNTGLTTKETPTWLPATGWRVANLRVVSSVPFQTVICSADVAYTANMFAGKHIPMEIRGMSYKVWGNDDGSEIYTDVHNWPTEAEQKDGDNAFNRALVVNGHTFEQDMQRDRQAKQAAGAPTNIIEAMMGQQAAYTKQVEAHARAQGIPVDQIEAAEEEKTRKYAESCRRSGGTWGWPTDKYGNEGTLGCYHPTGER